MDPEIRAKLRRITDILWAGGVVNPVTYIEQISYLIYLKMLDEQESQYEQQEQMTGQRPKSLFPKQAKRFRWQEWCNTSGEKLRDFLGNEVFKYMGSQLIKDAPKIASFFQSAVLEIRDPAVLKEVIDELDSIKFSKLGPDVKGDIFEYLLSHLGQAALNGQFRTPRQIRAFMTQMVDPNLGDKIFDPACGTGGFLIDAVDYILAKYSEQAVEVPIYGEDWLDKKKKSIEDLKKEIPNLQTYKKGSGELISNWDKLEKSIYGVDVSRQIMRIAVMNAVLHGIPNANIKRANTLSKVQGLTEDDIHRQYKVILSNPPFAGKLPTESIRDDLPTNSKKSELLFLSVMMKSLDAGGWCAVVVPEGLLFGSTTAHKDLREKLLNEFELRAVVSLPAGVFKPYAGVKTAVLVFRKPVNESKKGSHTKHVWFYEVKNDGYDPEKITGGVRPETPEKNDIPGLLAEWQKYKSSGFKKIPGVKAREILEPGSEEPKCWWAEYSMIKQNDFNLAAGGYKPQISEAITDEDPIELIKEALSIEDELTSGLKTLLKELESS